MYINDMSGAYILELRQRIKELEASEKDWKTRPEAQLAKLDAEQIAAQQKHNAELCQRITELEGALQTACNTLLYETGKKAPLEILALLAKPKQ
jgi:BMFP domain-containing protein YqiC